MGFIALVVFLFSAGLLLQWAARKRDIRRFPPPGRLIDIGPCRLHLHVTGDGGPTVLLESGVAASSVSWELLRRGLASDGTRVCTYDRSGLGWSELSSVRRSPRQIVDELRTLLARASVPGPYLIVGHSFGGLLACLHASWYPDDVVGLVLLDPAHTCEWAHPSYARLRMLQRGIALSRRGAWLARIGFVRLALSMLTGGARKLPKLMAKLSSGTGASVPERLVGEVRKLPPELWPVVQSHWCRPEAFQSMAEHLAVLPAVAAEVADRVLAVPTTVISQDGLNPEQLAEHRAVAGEHGTHVIAGGSGHWIHLDRPDLVLEAIRRQLSHYG